MNNTELLQAYNNMLESGIIPVIEIEIPDGDFVTVTITADDLGMHFDFDQMDLSTHFSGIIEDYNSTYMLPWDEDYSLDAHINNVYEEVLEGFIIPNNLYTDGE